MINIEAPIIPYEGTEDIKLYSKIADMMNYLKDTDTPYSSEVWNIEDDELDGKDPDPWTIINIDDVMRLFFASNDKLFKIIFLPGYKGSFPNGITTSTPFKEALSIDPSLKFDDWEEKFFSDNGYFMETDYKDEKILNISIFIREMETPAFDNYEWQRS